MIYLSSVFICFCIGGWILLSASLLSRQSPTHPYPYPLGLWTSHRVADLRPPRLPQLLLCTASQQTGDRPLGPVLLSQPAAVHHSHVTSAWGPGRAWHCVRDSEHQPGKRSQGREQTEGLLNVLSLKSLHSEAGRNSSAIILVFLSPLIRRRCKFNSVGVCRTQMQSRRRQTLAFCSPCFPWAPTKTSWHALSKG